MATALTTAELIAECGEKTAGKCSNCGKACLYVIEDGSPIFYSPFGGLSDKRPRVCSWCDVSVDARWD